jgi:hypothetical protein
MAFITQAVSHPRFSTLNRSSGDGRRKGMMESSISISFLYFQVIPMG